MAKRREHPPAGDRYPSLGADQPRFVLPDHGAVGAVHGEHVALAGLNVQPPVNRDRRALLRRVRRAALKMVKPGAGQAAHVAWRDLRREGGRVILVAVVSPCLRHSSRGGERQCGQDGTCQYQDANH